MYMPPLTLNTQGKAYEFADAGFAGFNNPVELAHREAKSLWPRHHLGLVLSIGTGLSGLAASPDRRWAPTDRYAEPHAELMISKLDPSQRTGERPRKNAMAAVRQLAFLAIDTRMSHLWMTGEYPSSEK